MICLISFSKFSDVLPGFSCARSISNLLSIYLGANISNLFPCAAYIENIPLKKSIKI